MIDRIRPTKRPDRRVRGYQQWRSLLFQHWQVSTRALRSLVPESLELDLLDGKAYVGVVPFVMEGVRPAWCPSAAAFNFLETNVRTYVIHRGQPGVYFFSLDAASRLAVWAARTFWGLPYFDADMSHETHENEIDYRCHRVGGDIKHRVRYRLGEMLGPSVPESPEFFFLERYLLFVERHNRMCVGQVHHAPYPAQRAEVLELEDDLVTAAGLAKCGSTPDFVHYASGVDVEIFGLELT